MNQLIKVELTSYEKKRIEDRAFYHWKRSLTLGHQVADWKNYWKTNKKSWQNSAITFKRLLSDKMFNRYLYDYDCNPWTLHNLETMNG